MKAEDMEKLCQAITLINDALTDIFYLKDADDAKRNLSEAKELLEQILADETAGAKKPTVIIPIPPLPERHGIKIKDVSKPSELFLGVINLLQKTQQASGMKPVSIEIGNPPAELYQCRAGIQPEKIDQLLTVGAIRNLYYGFRIITNRLVALYANNILILTYHIEGEITKELVYNALREYGNVCPEIESENTS